MCQLVHILKKYKSASDVRECCLVAYFYEYGLTVLPQTEHFCNMYHWFAFPALWFCQKIGFYLPLLIFCCILFFRLPMLNPFKCSILFLQHFNMLTTAGYCTHLALFNLRSGSIFLEIFLFIFMFCVWLIIFDFFV